MQIKTKPTKVTKDDIELADELSRITTIKSYLDDFSAHLSAQFAELVSRSYQGNAVATHFEILDKQDALETGVTLLQTDLLRVLGEVEQADAEFIAETTGDNSFDETAVEVETPVIEAAAEHLTEKE